MAITNSTIAQAVNDLVDYWDSFNVEYAAWLNGVVGGGPNLDGEYPLTDYLGNVTLTLCPAALEASVTGVVDSANAYATAAQAAQAAAEIAQTAAELAETNADLSEAQALSYRDAALAAQTAAESARTTAIAQAAAAAASALAASASETAAAASEAAAALSETNAATSETNAATSETNADLERQYAAEWANKAEDVLVSSAAGGDLVDDYSAFHWAQKAEDFAAAADLLATADEVITGAWTFSNYLNLTPMAAPAWAEGRLYYDSTEKALSYYNDEADVTINLGQENVVRARNTTGVTITNGSVVYISGAQGANLPLISLAKGDALATAEALGVVTHDIENNSNGYVTTLGVVRDLNTSSYTAGDELFLSTSVAGGLTNVRPTAGYAVPIGYVTVVNVSIGEIKVTMHADPISKDKQATWDSAVFIGTYTQEDHHTYLNRDDPANPVFRVAQVGAGPIAQFGKVPSLGSVGYTASVEIRANAVTVLDTAGDDYTYRMARSGVISGGFYHDATTQYWLNSAGNWFVKNDYGTVDASFAGAVNALGLNITGNADITGSLDVLDAAGGNSHFNYGVGQNYLSHLTGNFTRFRSFDGVSTYTDIAEFSDDGLKITSTSGGGNMLHLHGTSPQIYLQDTDASSHDFWFHVNSNNLYILNDTNDSGSWSSPYPMQIESDTQNIYFFGHDNMTANLDGQSYFGIHINGADNGWIRATSPGFLPHTSGGGSSALGTTAWPWTDVATQALTVVGTNSNYSSFSQANVVYCPEADPGSNGIHMYPVLRGAAYRGTGPITGYCRVRYPTGMTNDSIMHSFIIRGYNYSSALDGDGGGWAIEVGGYKYSSENWLNNTAHIIYGSPPFDRVHFGEDETGDYAYVLLGQSTTQWDYPQIYISDLMAGYGSYLHDIGSGFWEIDISASTPTNWSQDAGTGTAYIGGQIRWEGDPGSSIAAGKNLGGRCVISTSTASGGQDGDIWYQY